jgi:hypothetical protein
MVKELTELNIYAALKSQYKGYKGKDIRAEMEIKLNEETVGHVPEHM